MRRGDASTADLNAGDAAGVGSSPARSVGVAAVAFKTHADEDGERLCHGQARGSCGDDGDRVVSRRGVDVRKGGAGLRGGTVAPVPLQRAGTGERAGGGDGVSGDGGIGA